MQAQFDIATGAAEAGRQSDCIDGGGTHRLSTGTLAVPLLAAFVWAGPMAVAQEAEDEAEEDEVAEEVETLVVTGSRLRRNTYDSLSPLQITSAEVKRESGLVDAGEILQESSSAAGTQIDLTFQGYVLDDGPGTVTANLRGLGASRTLVLVNGRRIGPAGVEGAPRNPDLGILPGILIRQYDELLDGASSVYGSDAVAGVINVILKKDFDGFEFTAQPSFSTHGAGDETSAGAMWGRNFDRGFVGVGIQYLDSEAVTLDDRPWTAGCQRHVEIDQSGQIRNEELFYPTAYGMEWDDCTVGLLAGRVSVPSPNFSIYHTPGYSNGGWRNFSESSMYGFGIDGDGDGQTDLTFRDYSLNGREQFGHLFAPRTAVSAMAYGEYTLEGEANVTPYFELLYATRDSDSNGGAGQLFPFVPALNPFNLCNPLGEGVDCGLAQDALFTNPNFIAQFAERFAGTCARFGVPPSACAPATFGLLKGEIGPQPTRPIVALSGDRNLTNTDVRWHRYVGGVRGDIPFLTRGSWADWTFDLSLTATKSAGTSTRLGVRQDRLELALGYYSRDWTPCERNIGPTEAATRTDSSGRTGLLTPLPADAEAGCVPVNMFASSLYTNVIGDFATQAERDYVFGSRNFVTDYDQTVLSYYMSGEVGELPAGAVAAGFGLEYRIDDIASKPDAVARDGLFWGFFADGGAVGDKYTREAFGEVEIPILANMRFATEMDLNLSARWTDDEFYGGAWTGAAKLGYRPVDSLLVRATYGTSYRAPNLRELFLQAQTGFTNVSDPCLLPEGAIDDLTGEYMPELDRRDPHVLANCRAHGVDPTIASNNGFNTYNAEVAEGGSLTLDEETSKSSSVGLSWQQPFSNAFDLRVGLSYYDIEITDTIIEPSVLYIIGDCYLSQTSAHTFCERIRRDPVPTRPLINYIDQSFINRDSEKVRGVDLNVTYEHTLTLFDRPFELLVEVRGHRMIERSTLQTNDAGDLDQQFFHRRWAYAEHRGEGRIRVDYDRWRLTWNSRYVGNQRHYSDGSVDDWDDISGDSDTCLGPPDDILCRDVGWAGNYWLHHASVAYRADTWSVLGGVRNVFDTWPPQVDGSEVRSVNNTPIGVFYDLQGREFFVGATYAFGGGG